MRQIQALSPNLRGALSLHKTSGVRILEISHAGTCFDIHILSHRHIHKYIHTYTYEWIVLLASTYVVCAVCTTLACSRAARVPVN
jgi:hypothetical protein